MQNLDSFQDFFLRMEGMVWGGGCSSGKVHEKLMFLEEVVPSGNFALGSQMWSRDLIIAYFMEA